MFLSETKWEITAGRSKPIKYYKTADQKHLLFSDESTLQSFVRRLAFTTDGAFLVTPAALWYGNNNNKEGEDISTTNNNRNPSHATLLFARHKWDEPCRVLTGLDKVCGERNDASCFWA